MTDTLSPTMNTMARSGAPSDPVPLAPQDPGNRRARRRRTLTWVLVVATGTVLIFGQLLGPAFGDRPVQGPKGSSHSTTGNGVAALAELATGFNYRVVRYGYPLKDISRFSKHPIAENATLVILDADITQNDLAEVRNFVRNGGTLLANLNASDDWLTGFHELRDYGASYTGSPSFSFGQPTEVQRSAVDATATTDDGTTFSLRVLAGSSFTLTPDPTDPGVKQLVRNQNETSGIGVKVDRGQIFALTDASMFSNDLLDQGDNATFALALFGPISQPVVFAEEPHGYRTADDATGLPRNVRWFLGGLLIATLTLMWSRSRRNGPPEYPTRELAPARSQYLLSLSSEIDRATKPRSFVRGPRSRQDSTRSTPTPPHVPTERND